MVSTPVASHSPWQMPGGHQRRLRLPQEPDRAKLGNLSTHIYKLEDAGYIAVEKGFNGKKPQTMIHLTESGRDAFGRYKRSMQQLLDDLPE